MLTEPEDDPERARLDAALVQALSARLRLGTAAPDAEAIALRRLLAQAPGGSRPVLRAAWGRLVGRGSPIAATAGTGAMLAADRFGLEFRVVADAETALKAALGGSRAVIEIGSARWWGQLLALPEIAVVGALPDDAHDRPTVLVVARAQPGPTGDDRTFWVTDDPRAPHRIATDLGDLGLAGSLLIDAGGLKLFMLAGYVQRDDPRLAEAPGRLTGVIGAAPVF